MRNGGNAIAGKRSESPDPVVAVADALDGAGIPYVFTGALALAYWGDPRSSLDVDVVVHGGDVAFSRFLTSFAPDADTPALLQETREFGHVMIPLPLPGGGRVAVDLIRPRLGTIDRRVLSRAVSVPFPGRATIPIVTAEDLIVFKLIFFRQDEKHDDLRDIESILRRQAQALDTEYITRTLGDVYPPDDRRVAWVREALRRHGLPDRGS